MPMKFYCVLTEEAVTVPEIRATLSIEYPNTSIPDEPESLVEFGFEPVLLTDPPAVEGGQRAVEDGFELVDETWEQRWRLEDIPQEELDLELAAAKEAKNHAINAERLARNQTHFTYLGKQVACDPLSRSDIDATNGYVALFGEFQPGWAGGWKCIDNSYVPLATVTQWKAFYTSMVNQGSLNFGRSQQLKASLAAATSIEEIDSISW